MSQFVRFSFVEGELLAPGNAFELVVEQSEKSILREHVGLLVSNEGQVRHFADILDLPVKLASFVGVHGLGLVGSGRQQH